MPKRIWQLIVEHGDLRRVEAALVSEYGVGPEIISADLAQFVDKLVKKELVEVEMLPA